MEDHSFLEDRQLLQRFVKDNSQEAFALLTTRYLNLVYAACRRELADDQAAEDVTQAVFLILARKAPSFGRGVVLSGWLFQTARFAAKNARLQAQRRVAYEQKAAETIMEQQTETEDEQWAEIEPLLNQSLAALKSSERDCVLLRFFQGQSFAEVGASLGLSEEAARKRVIRSLEKMRQFFTKHGVIIPAIVLPVLLATHAAKATPAACQGSVAHLSTTVLAGHTAAALTGSQAYQISQGTIHAMKIAQIKLAVGITVGAAAVVTGLATYTSATSFAKPSISTGHILIQGTGSKLTAAQIATHCRESYGKLQTYQVDSGVTTQIVINAIPLEEHTSATIQYASLGKIHVEGQDAGFIPLPWAYTSDGVSTVLKSNLGGWRKIKDTESAIATVTGISLNAGTTIPAVLLNTKWGMPLALGKQVDPQIREDSIDGHLCYLLGADLKTTSDAESQHVWIDERTFLLHRVVSDRDNGARTIPMNGKPYLLPASKQHIVEEFTNEKINEAISASTFTLPAAE